MNKFMLLTSAYCVIISVVLFVTIISSHITRNNMRENTRLLIEYTKLLDERILLNTKQISVNNSLIKG